MDIIPVLITVNGFFMPNRTNESGLGPSLVSVWTVMFIPDPDPDFLPIPDPGFRNPDLGVKNTDSKLNQSA
jgi:hypothetical protein